MTSRSLTEVFILMRNNAMQSRHIYSEQQMTDRMSLVGSDIEAGFELRRSGESRMPPVWADGLEEAQYSLTRLKSKIHDLDALHTRHLHRPTLDDSSEEEQQIEVLTQDHQGTMFGAAHRLIQQIRHQSGEGGQQEQRLSYNVISSLVTILQELSVTFRRSQNSYLKKERSRQYFDTALDQDFSQMPGWELDSEVDNIDQQFGLGPTGGGNLTQQQQLLLLEEENTRMVARREHEVKQIVKSIADLNDIFKDLAHMVADQGTVLDRIDYNIEQCQIQVQQGYQQLQKADTYQRKNRKMVCILVLASVTIVLLILLILLKT
ncbi:hypothetical protein L9F63_004021 [Diploptera punctata]|uniref:t-SNARE coiled-coil homology domain-containing protein n=1 Tax=Diploptera punctata TaxID=6984 RepID=A0AAD7ZH96_DIPPU|nr:hypothetical protein L9F63_004021 [Diploptera punctata]